MRIHLVMLVCSGLLLPLSAFAGTFTARVGAGMLVVNRADNLWGGGKATIESLDAKPKGTTHLYGVPMFDLRYRHDALDNTYYLGTTQDEPGSVVAGVRHTLGKGAFDTSFSASFFGTEWENPYLLNRRETDVRTFAFKAAWENIRDSGFRLSYRVQVKELDNDLSGALDSRLKRDGTTHRVEGAYKLRIARGMSLEPMLAYERGAAEGSANEYNGGSAALSLIWKQDTVIWTNRISGTYSLHDELNPVFGQRRREPGYGVSSIAVFPNAFGREDVSVTLGFLHAQTFSTIDFFEKRSETAFALVGYSF